jgi:hypothetical protein
LPDVALDDSVRMLWKSKGKSAGKAEVIRSEEELKVGKSSTEAGTARLRKWVETEPVAAGGQN